MLTNLKEHSRSPSLLSQEQVPMLQLGKVTLFQAKWGDAALHSRSGVWGAGETPMAGSWKIPKGTSCMKGGYTSMLPGSLGKVRIYTGLEGIAP